MKEILLTQGKVTLVDDEDFDILSQHKWFAKKSGNNYYARRQIRICKGKQTGILMHRQILNIDIGTAIDHINGNSLDNRKINLRIANQHQNQANQKIRENMTSQYKGVSWHKYTKKWQAQIMVKQQKIHLGYYYSEIFAAHIYDEYAKKYFGQFARVNFETTQMKG